MVTLTTADQALKDVYLEVITNQLNKTTDALFSKIEATSENVSGNTIKKLVPYGTNGGIGARSEVDALPEIGESKYLCLTSSLKNLYGQICLSDKAIRASQSDSGAFVNLLNAEMENLIETGKFNLMRILYGKGNGYLCTVTSSQNNSAILQVNNAGCVAIGMRIRALLNGTEVELFNNAVVTDVDYSNKTITLSVAMDSTNANQALELYTFDGVNGESMGLAGLSDTSITEIYGVDRTTTAYLTPAYSQNSSYTIPTLTKVFDDLQVNANSHVDIISCGYNFRRRLQNLLRSQSFNIDNCVLAGGYKTISYMGIPLYASRFVIDNCAYLVDTSVWHMHQLCDWSWITNNRGEVLHQREGYPVHTATLVKYCDLICDRPQTYAYVKWGS